MKSVSENYQLSLLVTTACNLRCKYCHCNKDIVQHMSVDCAIDAIDETLSRHEDRSIQILFMGGEPFIAFDLMRECVSHVRRGRDAGRVTFCAVTNGTLVHDEFQDWIRDNADIFQIVLSLDGTREQHELSRTGSYDMIDLEFFRSLNRKIQVSMVASPQTLGHLSENIIALENFGFYVKCALADGVEWEIERDEAIYADELKKLIRHYCEHEETVPCNMLSSAIYCIPGEIYLPKCLPGITAHCIAPGGVRYPCYRCTPFYNNGNCIIPEEHLDLKGLRHLRPDCEHCIAEKICSACPASVASILGNEGQVNARCRFSKVMFLASAYFQIELLTKHPNHVFWHNKSEFQRHQIAVGAQRILEKLAIGPTAGPDVQRG